MTKFMDKLHKRADRKANRALGTARYKVTMKPEVRQRLQDAAQASGLYVGEVLEELITAHLPDGPARKRRPNLQRGRNKAEPEPVTEMPYLHELPDIEPDIEPEPEATPEPDDFDWTQE
jgi:hypothetical protein